MKHLRVFEGWKSDYDMLELVWLWINSTDNLSQKNTAKLVDMARSHKDLTKKSINYVKEHGGFLYRGFNLDSVELGKIRKAGGITLRNLSSFSVNETVARRFGNVIVKVPVEDIADKILLAVKETGLYDKKTRDKYRGYAADDDDDVLDEMEVIVVGPVTLPYESMEVLGRKIRFHYAAA